MYRLLGNLVSTHDNYLLSWVVNPQGRAPRKETQLARGITQSDVDQAADALLLAGERPTVDRIRQHLGTGSPNTVTRLLDVWWRALGPRLSAHQRKVALPAAPEPIAALASQFWEQALLAAWEQAETALAGERDALAAARLETDAQVVAANQSAEAARDAETQAAAALSAAQERFEDRQQLIAHQSAQLEDLARQRDDALARTQQSEQEAVSLRQQLESARLEAETTRNAQVAHLKAVEDRAHGEVDRARQEARELKAQLQARDRAQGARVRQLEAELAQTRAAVAMASQSLVGEQARREVLEQQMEDLRRSLQAALRPTLRVRSPRTHTKANLETTPAKARARGKKPK
jgi:hypothetical protein